MRKTAQTLLEFMVSMMILCLIIYGMFAVLRWGMMDMAERRFDHDRSFRNGALGSSSVAAQLNPDFHQVRPMDATIFKQQ